MSVATQSELVEALRANDPDRVLGTKEDDWLDFKKEPYRLDEDKGRWEYAKDVAALANTRGGVIVIGFKTSRSATELESKAASYELVPKHIVTKSSHDNVLAHWVYPELVGVRLTWFPDDGEVGFLVIEVPKQSPRDQPFIVCRMQGPGENPTPVAMGIPWREGPETRWMRPERLHARLTGTSGAGGGPGGGGPQEEQTDAAKLARADKRLESVRDAIESADNPSYVLQAVPPGRQSFVRDLHGPVRAALENPPSLRGHMGFNLKFAGPLEPSDGGLANLGSRHAIWVDRDGLFTYGVNAGPDFLGWGVNENRREPPYVINSLALVETTLEFFRTVYLVLGPRVPAGEWQFRVAAHRWKQARLALVPGPPEAVAWAPSLSLATQDDLRDAFDGTGTAPKDAFLALERVYGMFGMPPQDIPFAEKDSISEAEIRGRSIIGA